MAEAVVSESPQKLRGLFAIMLHICGLSDANSLWQKYRNDLAEDFKYMIERQNPDIEVHFSDAIFNMALLALEDKVLSLGGSQLQQYGLPQTERSEGNPLPTELLRETAYDVNELQNYVTENEPKLLPDQKEAYDTIINAVFEKKGGIFFLDAPGGTGKTFLTNLLLSKIRQHDMIAVAVASSGIAATLLPGGRTAHSTFKLPLNLATNESATCNIGKGSGSAKLLQRTSLIVWTSAPCPTRVHWRLWTELFRIYEAWMNQWEASHLFWLATFDKHFRLFREAQKRMR
jgi:hypothetical protein